MDSPTVLDAAVLAVLVCEMMLSARRGFAQTACALVGTLLSTLGGIIASGTLTGAIIRSLNSVAGEALAEELMAEVPGGAERVSREAALVILGDIELRALRPLVFAMAFFAVLSLWLYLCYYFGIINRFPVMERFNQLSGAALGLLKGAVILASALYVLTTLGLFQSGMMEKSAVLGPLVRLWGRLS